MNRSSPLLALGKPVLQPRAPYKDTMHRPLWELSRGRV